MIVKPFCGAVLAACVLAVLAGPARADAECHPVVPEAIAKAWTDATFHTGARPDPTSDLYECMLIERARTTVCRTRSAHPAHPSIVIRAVVRRRGGWFVDTTAQTAGACEPFLAMLREFDALTAEQRERLARERAAQPDD